MSVSTLAGGGNLYDGFGTNAQFYHPTVQAIDYFTGNVYVVDNGINIRVVTSSGNYPILCLCELFGFFGGWWFFSMCFLLFLFREVLFVSVHGSII